jgi:threonine dehydratase
MESVEGQGGSGLILHLRMLDLEEIIGAVAERGQGIPIPLDSRRLFSASATHLGNGGGGQKEGSQGQEGYKKEYAISHFQSPGLRVLVGNLGISNPGNKGGPHQKSWFETPGASSPRAKSALDEIGGGKAGYLMPFSNLPFRLDVPGAAETISPHVRRTPVLRTPELENPGINRVFLKLENLQTTGSFKVRGAANRILSLEKSERNRGVVACSSGNHGRAVAHMAGKLGISALICVPDWVDAVKLSGMKKSGAEVVLSGASYDEAEATALELAEREGRIFVQPFDDPWVAAGQGTLGLELMDQVPGLETVLIPLSGGGLAGGVAYAIKEQRPEIRLVAVSAANARVMYESLQAGKPVTMEEEPTLAEALSGGIGLTNRYSLPLIRELIDEHLLVSEDEIRTAMLFGLRSLGVLLEGGGAVALAALLAEKYDVACAEGTVAVVLSGGNVALPRLQKLAEDVPA